MKKHTPILPTGPRPFPLLAAALPILAFLAHTATGEDLVPISRVTEQTVETYDRTLAELESDLIEAANIRADLKQARSTMKETSVALSTAEFEEANQTDLARLRFLDRRVARSTDDLYVQVWKANYVDFDEADYIRARRQSLVASASEKAAAERNEEDLRQLMISRSKEVSERVAGIVAEKRKLAGGAE